jgi:hypothetical protein
MLLCECNGGENAPTNTHAQRLPCERLRSDGVVRGVRIILMAPAKEAVAYVAIT